MRFTQDVDILLRRNEFDAARKALESANFIHRHSAGLDIFLDGATGKARDAVHIFFANEKVRESEPISNPDVSASERGDEYRVLSLLPLVQIKLTAFRDKDRMHLRDMIDVGLVDQTWTNQLPPELALKLQSLLDTPGG